jgi:hypothetical protein
MSVAAVMPMANSNSEITTDVQTLAAAFQLSYHAGRGDAEADRDALVMIERTCTNMLRALRDPKPGSRDGIEGGLDLMRRAARERLGHSDLAEFYRG